METFQMAKKAKTPATKKNASAAAAKEPSTPPEDPQAASEQAASERAEPIVGMKRTYFLSNFPMTIGHERMKTTVADAGFRRGRIWA
jgi:hypothetical protein